MAVKTRWWITAWFLLSAPIIAWDVGYCFMRPRSMKVCIPPELSVLVPAGTIFSGSDTPANPKTFRGVICTGFGALMRSIKRYAKRVSTFEYTLLYANVDYVYGLPALERNDGFTNAQSLMNVIETLLNVTYVYLAYVAEWPGAPLIGFGSTLMTVAKTILYWANEYYCGFCQIGHNDALTLAIYWILPNGLWIVVPSIITWVFAKDIVQSLTVTSSGMKSGKAQKKKNN